VTYWQAHTIRDLLKQKGYTESDLLIKYPVGSIASLSSSQAAQIMANLKKLPDYDAEAESEQIANDAAAYLS
jgi:hypothetical protein